jgi:hypothetical protein
VKGTFLQATEALAQVEARAAAERSTSVSEPVDIAAEIAAEIEKLDEGLALGVGADESVEVVAAIAVGDSDAEVETALADVDSLFARLRAGHDDVGPDATDPAINAAVGNAGVGEAVGGAEGTGAPAPIATGERPKPAVAAPTPNRPRFSDQEWRTRRSKGLDPLLPTLVKRAKRRAQDDQNGLLDSVRRHKGRPTSQQVLGEAEAARDTWAEVMRETLDRSYAAGRTATGAGPSSDGAPADLVADLADTVALPLRERLVVAIDSGVEGDAGGLVERIGARYREWKNQSLEATLGEALATAWNRGVYDAAPDDAVLWWVPLVTGRCSDCDDNALEPTVKGKQFPTGQALPPAHPGCKCLLVPADMLTGK